jgi:hypothetical protein
MRTDGEATGSLGKFLQIASNRTSSIVLSDVPEEVSFRPKPLTASP